VSHRESPRHGHRRILVVPQRLQTATDGVHAEMIIRVAAPLMPIPEGRWRWSVGCRNKASSPWGMTTEGRSTAPRRERKLTTKSPWRPPSTLAARPENPWGGQQCRAPQTNRREENASVHRLTLSHEIAGVRDAREASSFYAGCDAFPTAMLLAQEIRSIMRTITRTWSMRGRNGVLDLSDDCPMECRGGRSVGSCRDRGE